MRYLIFMEYDGLRFKGFQRLADRSDTIQGIVEDSLFSILGCKIKISGAGRTDAGVSAINQSATFDIDRILEASFATKVNSILPREIRIKSVEQVDETFHARYSAVSKIYRYRLFDGEVRDVFGYKYYYEVQNNLDDQRLLRACELLSGCHDYIGFSSDKKKKDTVRNVGIKMTRNGHYVDLFFEGDGFLYNMVRILTGTILGYAQGTISEEDIACVFNTKNRIHAGITMPPNALMLVEVKY